MRIYGHRGAQGEAPESTIPGFRHAIAIGLDAVEFDVQLTADHRLVVFHDRTVDRTTNGFGPVSSYSLETLRKLDARAQFPDWPEPCHIPTLDEVLDVTGELPHLLVEIKRDAPPRLDYVVPATISLVRQRGLAGQVTLSSFDPYALELAQRFGPDIPRMMNGAWRAPGLRECAIATGCAHVDFDSTQTGAEHIAWARAHGLSIIGWPGNTATDLAVLREYGVDAIGSDHPSLMQRLLAQSPLTATDDD
jgi:glycerophosphoryl diester phosphodiesterase